jgi:hypothetical protein
MKYHDSKRVLITAGAGFPGSHLFGKNSAEKSER